MQGKVDPNQIYFAVVHKADLTVIRILCSAEQARSYIKPLAHTGEYQIERVYLDPYVEETFNYKLTWLDRPSCKSLREAFEQKKIQRLRIRSPEYIRSSHTVLTDRKLKGKVKELVQCSIVNASPSQTEAKSSTSTLGA